MSWALQSTELEISLEGGKTLVFPPLQLYPGELVLLKGNSGSGKSTWMHALAGLLPMRSGHVEIVGHPVYRAQSPTPRGWRRHALGLMPQRAFFWNSLSLHENLALAAWAKGISVEPAPLDRVGLAGKERQSTRTLSLGEQQRVNVLRAFMGNAPVILADEPTASLDDMHAQELLTLLREIQGERAMLVSSHDARLAPFVDRIITLP